MPDEINVKVEDSPTAGSGLFALKTIPAGSLVFSLTRPLIAVLDIPRLANTCSNCFEYEIPPSPLPSENHPPEITVKACTGCKTLKFCSKRCQSQAWKRSHKYECAVLSKAHTPEKLPNAVRATMQVIRMREGDAIPEEQWKAFLDLESHMDTIRSENGPRMKQIEVLAMGAWSYSYKTASRLSLNITETQDVFSRVSMPYALKASCGLT